MIEVKFNAFQNGACPLCKKHKDCYLLKAMSIGASVSTKKKKEEDADMEIVVYRCTEFEDLP